ncbi:La-related protein 6 [Clonorchis sinensis]|uniref:La-related protein 6 n=1 Tax=Clonorchis sinensis TaxID=79923 RepID=H2KSJ7_CLOSI|nr:La-related protein 6 [Clonorchis sinensis]
MDDAVTQIREQCEFYFSDANILKDQFMLNQVKSSTDGWVKLGIIEKFKKVQRLTQDHSVVVRALSMSSKLELSEDGMPNNVFHWFLGLSVRRRDPLPSWDPSVYHRTIILTDLPEDVELNHAKVTELFTTDQASPLLVRLFLPGRKVPSDLKRSQALHPQLGTKFSAVIEFANRTLASKAISRARQHWPDAYVHLLSYGSKKPTDANPKKKEKKVQSKDLEQPSSPQSRRPAFLLNLKSPNETIKVVHIRQPVGPPTEDSTGFPPGWRDSLRFQRISLSNMASVPTSILPPALPPDDAIVRTNYQHSVWPNDSAIVSIIPYPTVAVNSAVSAMKTT